MSEKKRVTEKSKIIPLLRKHHSSKEIAELAGVSLQAVYRVRHFVKKKRREAWLERKITNTSVDMINHPPHYTAGRMETIDFIEAKQLNYNLGNVVKYISRVDLKGNGVDDLRKAAWYLNREIAARK